MRQARDKIDKGAFHEFRNEFVSNYETRERELETL
jgi:queuine/archaeosine tRNA-ribosyltransferase